jgi:hypothetical protein
MWQDSQVVTVLCSAETKSETLISIITYGEGIGLTYFDSAVTEDQHSCDLTVYFKKNEQVQVQ